MPGAGADNLTNDDSADARRIEYANDLYHKVVGLCQDWDAVDESKARLIVEYASDALKAFGDTNQEKKVELKAVLERAEQLISPDSIDSFKRRSEKAVLKELYPRNKKLRRTVLIFLGLCWLAAFCIPGFIFLKAWLAPSPTSANNAPPSNAQQGPAAANTSPGQQNRDDASQPAVVAGDEPHVTIDKATVSLDLTSSWVELNRQQREEERISRGILRGVFTDVRKLQRDATFTHRVGTTSNFRPDWRAVSPHGVTHQDEMHRKCNPRTKYAYMLYFDIGKERVNVPFDLRYEIVFWNAHNGETEDWQSFFVSRPTKQLTMRVSFPVNKPYKKLHFKHTYGINCQVTDFKDFPNPDVKETIDRKTGAKVMTWTIDRPEVYWIYMVGWDW
jgi:hypothetical protein